MDSERGQQRPMGGLGMSVGRLEAFSDGVLAIVITLLILNIGVPEPGAEAGSLAKELGRQWPEYLAYLLSFMTIGIIWLNHHATINLLARTDHTLQVLNLLLLLPVSILPWPTELLSRYARAGGADERLSVIIYGGASTAMVCAFHLLWRHLLRHPELHKPGISRELLAVRNRRFLTGLAVYPIATGIGLISTPVFLALMLALALLYLLPTPDVQITGPG